MLDKATIENLLTALGKQIELMKEGPIEIVVCGGASLNVLGQIKRTTKDIDIMGIIKRDKSGKLDIIEAVLPQWFIGATERVRKDFNLPENWINVEATSIVRFGLPKDFTARMIKKRYSKALWVYYISRLDQIHFKLYASVDRGGHHVDDLIDLKPTNKEIEQAASWSMTHDISEGFRLVLKDLLKKLDFQNVSQKI
ncbi:MAG: hypothetical protein GTN73_10240 [Candidatus Aminicenantes bacterium]|nr:hypothetical protein [Candidatus Aminicenantes bacterium]